MRACVRGVPACACACMRAWCKTRGYAAHDELHACVWMLCPVSPSPPGCQPEPLPPAPPSATEGGKQERVRHPTALRNSKNPHGPFHTLAAPRVVSSKPTQDCSVERQATDDPYDPKQDVPRAPTRSRLPPPPPPPAWLQPQPQPQPEPMEQQHEARASRTTTEGWGECN